MLLSVLVLAALAVTTARADVRGFGKCMRLEGRTRGLIFRSNAEIWNVKFDQNHITRDAPRPEAFYVPLTPADISVAVVCAAQSDLRVCARSGGHSWAASSLCSGVVIDLIKFKDITFSGTRMMIGAGVTTGEALYTAVNEKERFVPTGTCTSVGFAGYNLGGGIGTLSSSVGLGCDNVEKYNMVLANGSMIGATRKKNAELYNTLCGAGGGHLGVVYRMTMKTYNATRFNEVSYFNYEYDGDEISQIASLVKGWSEFNHDTVPNTYSRAQVIFSNGDLGRFRVFGLCWKADVNDCAERLAKFTYLRRDGVVQKDLKLLGGVLNAAPLTSGGKRFEFFTHFENAVKGNFRKTSSLIWKRNVREPIGFFQKAISLMRAGSADGKTVIAQWSPIGGKVRNVDNKATSFRFRDSDSSWDQYWFGRGGSEEAKVDFVRHISKSRNRMGLYVNYLDAGADVREYYPRGAFADLIRLKRKLDPDDIFEHVQPLESGSPAAIAAASTASTSTVSGEPLSSMGAASSAAASMLAVINGGVTT